MIDHKDFDFGKRLKDCLIAKKVSNSQITADLELNKNAIGNYKNGQIPNTIILYKLSNYLGISMEYLLTGKESTELNPDEQQLIDYYREADTRGKNNILRTAEAEAALKQTTSATSRIG